MQKVHDVPRSEHRELSYAAINHLARRRRWEVTRETRNTVDAPWILRLRARREEITRRIVNARKYRFAREGGGSNLM